MTKKEEKKSEWKQQYQKRKDYFKQYYQKNKETIDANNRKNAKKYREEYKQLKEENKKLKSDLGECECSMHFENDEVGYRKRECKKLKAELSKYKKQYQHSMGFMEEDTLQELKDIGEL